MDKLFDDLPDFLLLSEYAERYRLPIDIVLEAARAGKIPNVHSPIEGEYRIRNIIPTTTGIDTDSSIASDMYNEQKIGELVRQKMKNVLESNLLPDDVLQKLTNPKYCKYELGISFPLIKILPESYSVGDDLAKYINENGYVRYWRIPFAGKYLVTSQWYERHRKSFLNWIRKYEQ